MRIALDRVGPSDEVNEQLGHRRRLLLPWIFGSGYLTCFMTVVEARLRAPLSRTLPELPSGLSSRATMRVTRRLPEPLPTALPEMLPKRLLTHTRPNENTRGSY